MSAGSVGGGSGQLSITNNHTATVSDLSAAASQSGLSVALGPTSAGTGATSAGTGATSAGTGATTAGTSPSAATAGTSPSAATGVTTAGTSPSAATAGTSPSAATGVTTAGTSPSGATGVTTANSGQSAATGVTVSNDVSHTAIVAVAVGAGSQAPVTVNSSSSVQIQDAGAGAAVSGQAWAVAAGASGSPSGVATPVVAGAAPTSPNIATTGLQTQNNLANTLQSTVVSLGGSANTAPILITPDEVASVRATGIVNASSNPACVGGTTCSGANPTAGAASQAASGAATTQGLVAQNVVNTNAAVAVHVAGINFSPIQIIVNSVTHIFNLGIGSSLSGDATAGGGAQATTSSTAQTAQSGSVQATGAQITNTVDLRSTANVRVNGNNYNPIDIILNLSASLFNRGIATATSGDAQASSAGTGGAGSALSGGALATGLEVWNIVNMWAQASVDIEGNNYAPIVVDINFDTNIDNRGIAVATSGNVAAGKSGPASAGTKPAASGASANTTGGAAQGGAARGGDATAIANAMDAAFNSSQISGANGGQSISTNTITQMLRKLAPGTWDPFADNSPTPTTTGPVEAGVNSTSGNTQSSGMQSTAALSNAQMAACSDPGPHTCSAVNSATLSASIADASNNPAVRQPPGGSSSGSGSSSGGGGAPSAISGDALVNATPTPIPSSLSGSSTGSGSHRSSSGGTSRHVTFASRTVVTDMAASGHTVMVDLWDNWPGRRLPPMPNVSLSKPTSSTVDASLNGWPGADELPLPDATDAQPAQATGGGAPRAAAPSIRRSGASLDVGVGDEDTSLDVLGIVDVDPYAAWPDAAALPMPGQVLTAGAAAEPQTDSASADAAPAASNELPFEDFIVAGILTLVAAVGAASPRGRRLLLRVRQRIQTFVAGVSRWVTAPRFPSFGRQAGRALALLRMTLSLLHLW